MIRAVMRAWDGRGEPTRLTQAVLEALGLASEEDLLLKLYHAEIDRESLLDLVPLLFTTAAEGDAVARGLVIQMGTEVAVGARAILRRIGLGHEEEVEVVLGGSVFKGQGSLLLETVNRVLHEEFPHARLVPLEHEPVLGAALLALEAAGVAVTQEVYLRLAATAGL
jgi:N-acetylglucosamine kinase-like BadF-type ATPase